MRMRNRKAGSVLITAALSACGPHGDPTVAPAEVVPTAKFTPPASESMYDEKWWFGPNELRSIGAAALPFATYLNQLHAKLHPHFAGQFLAAMDKLPKTHPLQELSLATVVGLVIRGRDGQIVRRNVLRSSGSTSFDISALDAIDRASPFGRAPSATQSPDGNVYVHWELRRDEMACSTSQARPYILR